MNFSTNVLAMFDKHKILYCGYRINTLFTFLADLDALRAQRIVDFFYISYPQINEVRNYDHMNFLHAARTLEITTIIYKTAYLFLN